jgi:hypothetical protein
MNLDIDRSSSHGEKKPLRHKKSPPQKTLFKWNWEQGETVEELAARIVAHVRNQLLKGIKPEHFRPPPQNPN